MHTNTSENTNFIFYKMVHVQVGLTTTTTVLLRGGPCFKTGTVAKQVGTVMLTNAENHKTSRRFISVHYL